MLFTIFSIFLSIGILTSLAIKSEGRNSAEIKITLNFMNSNFKRLINNFQTLLLLLVKDLFSNSSKSKDLRNEKTIDIKSKISAKSDSMLRKEITKEDISLNEFTPETIDFIRNEEEKVA
tara:strand:- start:71 stop:430 length:360 start_codon:yes stop_codon:yes gene_type:complete